MYINGILPIKSVYVCKDLIECEQFVQTLEKTFIFARLMTME